MKKLLKICTILTLSICMFACSNSKLSNLKYSNLVDSSSQDTLKNALLDADVSEDNINDLLNDINEYNDAIEDTSLISKGYEDFDLDKTYEDIYDTEKIISLYDNAYDEFIGFNCRITAYTLMKDKIHVENTKYKNDMDLFQDEMAFDSAVNKHFTDKEITNFECLYSTIQTNNSTSVQDQYNVVKKAWKKMGITFDDSKVKLITVFLDSEFDVNDYELFIGHAGVLVPYNDGYLFVEKLSFQYPYQMIYFDTKKDLYDYLMKQYDVDYGQNTAKPFVLENDELMGDFQ